MKYTVIVTESVLRSCEVEVEAESTEEAENIANKMWDDCELEEDMEMDEQEPYLESLICVE